MIYQATIAWAISLSVLVILMVLTTNERRVGHRLVAVTMREWLDDVVWRFGVWLERAWEHFVKYIVRLNWYYSIHAALRTLLQALVSIYSFLEGAFERNRARTKRLRAERRKSGSRTHLSVVAKHKRDTALSPQEQTALRAQKLEDEH